MKERGSKSKGRRQGKGVQMIVVTICEVLDYAALCLGTPGSSRLDPGTAKSPQAWCCQRRFCLRKESVEDKSRSCWLLKFVLERLVPLDEVPRPCGRAQALSVVVVGAKR